MTIEEQVPTCVKCQSPNTYMIKCNLCKNFICYNCSLIPDAYYILYKNSGSVFRCIGCIKGNLQERNINYETELDTLVQACAESSRNKLEQNGSDHSQNTTNEENTQVTKDSDGLLEIDGHHDNLRNKRNCRYHLSGKCRYTKNECRFEHPKLCRYFIRQKDDPRWGCKKRNCAFYHPKLCYDLENYGDCNRRNCKYYHRTNAYYNNELGHVIKNRFEGQVRNQPRFPENNKANPLPQTSLFTRRYSYSSPNTAAAQNEQFHENEGNPAWYSNRLKEGIPRKDGTGEETNFLWALKKQMDALTETLGQVLKTSLPAVQN